MSYHNHFGGWQPVDWIIASEGRKSDAGCVGAIIIGIAGMLFLFGWLLPYIFPYILGFLGLSALVFIFCLISVILEENKRRKK